MLVIFAATATTCDVSPGEEEAGEDGLVRIRHRTFTDIVKSPDPRIAGVNTPVLNVEINPSEGTATLDGGFTLRPDAVDGSWEGHMSGQIRDGLVTAAGLARGSGALAGAVMRVDFRQVKELPGPPPCENPSAFFEMTGSILQQD